VGIGDGSLLPNVAVSPVAVLPGWPFLDPLDGLAVFLIAADAALHGVAHLVEALLIQRVTSQLFHFAGPMHTLPMLALTKRLVW